MKYTFDDCVMSLYKAYKIIGCYPFSLDFYEKNYRVNEKDETPSRIVIKNQFKAKSETEVMKIFGVKLYEIEGEKIKLKDSKGLTISDELKMPDCIRGLYEKNRMKITSTEVYRKIKNQLPNPKSGYTLEACLESFYDTYKEIGYFPISSKEYNDFRKSSEANKYEIPSFSVFYRIFAERNENKIIKIIGEIIYEMEGERIKTKNEDVITEYDLNRLPIKILYKFISNQTLPERKLNEVRDIIMREELISG